ncbi:hypothetical protein B0T11DRAFT_347634 [Plectosphaerella cucumerina]|uniref:Reverse transcriptase n=1 Tax=Plectosphaerella cucumerina TaxID=40658 RepID=A0A8K0TTD4_9PEZI|nr:hypothetical protein B0T11DRAFT_347634 [Plectosphaerella cucumerina]
MDSTLTWKQHIDETERKVSMTITALSTLGNSAWVVRTKEMRTIYRGVAVPQMMYACSAWSNASWGGKGYTKRTLQRLERLQARAARVMSGAFKATSFPALDVEMHLLPIEQQIRKHNATTVGRMHGAVDPQPPSTEYPTKTSILSSSRPDKALKRLRRRQQHETDAIHVYTDGSGINGRIGAAAICTTTNETKSAYMGEDATKTQTGQQRRPDNGRTGPTADQPPEVFSLQSTLQTWAHKEANRAWQAKWTLETKGRTSFLPDITDDICPCREGRQTVSHVLLRCRRFRQLRRQELGSIPGRQDLRALLNKRKAAAKAIKFMEQTEILGQFRIQSQTRQS